MLRRIISVMLISCLVLIMTPIHSQAYSECDSMTKVVYGLISKYDKSIQVCSPRMLYNEEDKVVAVLYPLLPQGYVIVELNNNAIVEYSFLNSYPYVKNEKNYYNGPFQYYIKENETYKNVCTEELIDARAFRESRISYEKRMRQKEKDKSIDSLKSVLSTNSLSTTLRTFSYNPDGRCGSIAAAILFAYYDDAIDSSMVSSYLLSDSTGQIFSNYLKPYIEDVNPSSGSTTSELASGMGWYLATVGLSGSYSVISALTPQLITYVNCINLGRPVIVDLDAHPNYGEHWVVGYGYDTFLSQNYIIVNDGWGHNGIYISWSYVGDLVYLNYPN